MFAKRFAIISWIAVLSTHLLFPQHLLTAAVHPPTSSSSRRIIQDQSSSTYPYYRSLKQDVDGVTACKNCKSNRGEQCVGRTVQDANCDSCSKGQAYWPCNLVKECWCWDTALPRDPGDDDDDGRACSGCGRDSLTEVCVSNQNSLVPVGDEECAKCMAGQSFWPCDDRDLCWCWDTTKPKMPPAPASGLPPSTELDPNVKSPCEILTRDMFADLAPNSTFPYTYEGLCDAIRDYNEHHTEKFAAMGTIEHVTSEIASFLGNTAHESDDFEAGREYLACGDRKEVDGKVYCKPCNNDLYDWPNNVCSVSMVDQNAPYNSYCQPTFEPPEGCVCDTLTQVEEEGPLAGYVDASKVFYGRGAIQLSWNYNYIRASYALTGSASTFCEDPEQVARSPAYAWGTGIYFWMENQKEGSTCHKEALKGNFGGTLNNINGGLECPAYKGGWHADAIKMRLNRYCHAASQLGLEALTDLSGCKGMTESYEECLGDGHCPYCERYAGVEFRNFTDMEVPEPAAVPTAVPVPETDPPTDLPTSAPEFTVTTSEPTDPPPPTESPVAAPTNEPSQPPTVFFATLAPTSGAPTPSPSEGFRSASPVPPPTSSPPTLAPATPVPSASPHLDPTQRPSSSLPTYAPSTPQPTMGPCDGDSCPGEFCRSAYGFCGGGAYYCNDGAIWSPECKENSERPTARPSRAVTDEPTGSPEERANSILDGVFKVTRSPVEAVKMTRSPVGSGAGAAVKITRSPVGSAGAGAGGSAEVAIFTFQPVAQPTRKPVMAPSKGGSFSKPSGGKKPSGGGKPKPVYSSSGSDKNNPSSASQQQQAQAGIAQKQPPPISDKGGGVAQTDDAAAVPVQTEPPTPRPTPWPTRDPTTASPTPEPSPAPFASFAAEEEPAVLSPDDPESSFFCGADWADANLRCAARCPSSNSEDCPRNHQCYAFTSCVDVGVPRGTEEPSRRPTRPPWTAMPATPVPITPAPTDGVGIVGGGGGGGEGGDEVGVGAGGDGDEAGGSGGMVEAGVAQDEGCTGKPCPFAGECRSQYGFCGVSFIYCNALSSWNLEDCGLVGALTPGEPVVVCDAEETLRCPEGEEVHRDPADGCEYFPCPRPEEEGEVAAFSSPAFRAPAPGPAKLPDLPKPTLPIIPKPSGWQGVVVEPPAGGGGGTIDLGKKPSGSAEGTVVVIGADKETEDDGGEEAEDADGGKGKVVEKIGDGMAFFASGDWRSAGTRASRNSHVLVRTLVAAAWIVATFAI